MANASSVASTSLLPPLAAQTLPTDLERVVRLVDTKPEALARGDAEMYTAALAASRMIYELSLESEKSAVKPISKLLSGLSPEMDAPTTRAQKRKREEVAKPPLLSFKATPKGESWNPSLGAAKLWERMEHRTGPLCGILDTVVTPEAVIEEDEEEEEESDEVVEEDEDSEADYVADEDEMDYSMSDEDEEDEDYETEEDDEIVSDGGESHLGDTTMELSRGEEDHPDSSEGEDEDEGVAGGYLDGLDLDREVNPQRAAKRRAHPTLDDDFFSIDAFNRETEALEAQLRSSGALGDDEDDDEDENEDVDLFTTVHDVEDNEDDVNDPKYKDFFAPPSIKSKKSTKPQSPARPKRKLTLLVASPPKRLTKVRFNEEVRVRNVKSRRTRASLLAEFIEASGEQDDDIVMTSDMMDEEDDESSGSGTWSGSESEASGSQGSESEDDDEDGEQGTKKGDLFADDEPMDEDGTPLSSYQQRQAALSAEIEALEAENVAAKPWMLQGEATARSRPQNALLEADLEFEHVGKVVPTVTEESVKKLEDRIKARIIEGRYDDVVRKREVDPKPFLPSRTFELKDTQSEKSLAQIYEDEYTAGRAGAGPVDDRDGKLAQEHKEIEELWDGICYKLDALSNAHFTPKQPKAQITTVSNMASASLESALPTSLSTSTLLAPEEVYAPSPNDTRAKGELTPGEKRAARSKERKKRRKQRDALAEATEKFGNQGSSSSGRGQPRNVKEAKDKALSSLVKSGKGVTVVGKGEGKGKGKGIKAASAKKSEDSPIRDSKKLKL